jgi:CBS-domain-containing membrane protein
VKIRDIMTVDVKFCGPDTNLAAATEIMWRNNCGTLPVLDSAGRLIGIVTDRDIGIAVGTRNWRASDLAIRDLALKPVFTCGPNGDVHEALEMMCERQIRRVPVVDEDGRLAGIVCLDELALRAQKTASKKTADISYEDVVNTMKAICGHRAAGRPRVVTMPAGAVVAV